MASLSVGKGNLVLSFPNASIILNETDNTYTELMLEHVSFQQEEEEDENSDDNTAVVCSAISNSWIYFTCCVQKLLYLWETKNWILKSKRMLKRSGSALTFDPKDEKIAVADKGGDVYLFCVKNFDKGGELILGHISMILSILITPNNKFVITCDRDEKIRVSYYPNAYNILSYCLGHEEFVTCLKIIPHNERLLVSGSGDGTMKIWEYEKGKQILSHVCNHYNPTVDCVNKPVISQIVCLKQSENISLLCVHIATYENVSIYKIASGSIISEITCTFCQVIKLNSEPWCLNFDDDCLWIFKKNILECLLAYRFNQSRKEFTIENSKTEVNNFMNKHKTLLERVFKKDKLINTLYKRRFDNVQDYLKRKNERIETSDKKTKKEAIC